MKKFGLAIIVLTSVFILAACGSGEYKENMKKGGEKLESKNYEEAIQHFEKAQKADPEKSEAKQKLLSTQNQYFDSLFALGKSAFEQKEYTEAAELLGKAYEILPTKEEGLLKMKSDAEELNVKQKELDSYMNWLNETSQMNFSILKEWRTASDNFSIGDIQVKEFNEKARAMLKISDKLVIASEDQLSEISGDLAAAHTAYMGKLQDNHDQLRLVILETQNEKTQANKILTMGKNIPNIREMQALHVQSLKTYADTNKLKFSEN